MIYKQIGENIRIYRKLQNMSMQQLGNQINKSKAAVFKYEKGECSIDIETLLIIAKALNVEFQQLVSHVDVISDKQTESDEIINVLDNCYFYHYNGQTRGLIRGVFKVISSNNVTLYYDCDSKFDINSAGIIYWGSGDVKGHIVNLQMCNQRHQIETVTCTARLPLNKSSYISGFFTGLSTTTFNPIINKVIITKKPVTNMDALINALTINKEELASIKKLNTLVLSSEAEPVL